MHWDYNTHLIRRKGLNFTKYYRVGKWDKNTYFRIDFVILTKRNHEDSLYWLYCAGIIFIHANHIWRVFIRGIINVIFFKFVKCVWTQFLHYYYFFFWKVSLSAKHLTNDQKLAMIWGPHFEKHQSRVFKLHLCLWIPLHNLVYSYLDNVD